MEFICEVKQGERIDSHLIATLHKVQKLYGYLRKDILRVVADELDVSFSRVWGVATFYHYFKLKPVGEHEIFVCMGTACYVKGADRVFTALKEELGVEDGETTEDKFFTLKGTRCLGACGIAPVIMIDEKIYGDLTPAKVVEIVRKIGK